MTEMFGEAWSPMSVPDLAPDDDDDFIDKYFCEEKKTSRLGHCLPCPIARAADCVLCALSRV